MLTILDCMRDRWEPSSPTGSHPTVQALPMSLVASYNGLLSGFWQTPEMWLSTFSHRSAAQRHLATFRSILPRANSSLHIPHQLYQHDHESALSSDTTLYEKWSHCDSASPIASEAGSYIGPDNMLEHPHVLRTEPLHIPDIANHPPLLPIDLALPAPHPVNKSVPVRGEPSAQKPKHRRRISKDQRKSSTSSSGSDADDEGPISIPKRLRTTAGRSFDINSASWKDEDYVSSGTFGDIYKGQMNGRPICIKLIRPLQIQGDDVKKLTKAFHKESPLWTDLSHPNVLSFYGCRQDFFRPCLVTPWMENGNVNNYLLANPNANRYQLALDILNGLDYLHSNGIIHGGLKGANVLIDNLGRAQVADQGISSVIYSTFEDWGVTATAVSDGGIRRWEAPELFGCDSPDIGIKTAKSDVYAWSCVCYEMFMGKFPFFEIKTDDAVFFRIALHRATPTRPENHSEAWHSRGLIEEFWNLMTACWSWTPSSRPTILELLARTSRLAFTRNSQFITTAYPDLHNT